MFPCSHASGPRKSACVRPAQQTCATATSGIFPLKHACAVACRSACSRRCMPLTSRALRVKMPKVKWGRQCWQPVSSSPAGQHTVGEASAGRVLGSCTGQLGDSGSALAWQASRHTLSTVAEECRGGMGCALSMTGAMAVPTRRTGSEVAVHAPSRQAGRQNLARPCHQAAPAEQERGKAIRPVVQCLAFESSQPA